MWLEWHGEDYETKYSSYSVIYFTIGHIDIENEIVRRALASALQRDGIVDSLAAGFKSIDSSVVVHGWSGFLADEHERTYCLDNGNTYYGDLVEESQETTYIEIYLE